MPTFAHLSHRTRYAYDRAVNLGPHIVRLHPAPHCRTPVTAYALRVSPATHYIHWQQDPLANRLARLVFTQPCTEFEVSVDMSVELTDFNPFDFFLDPSANSYPFAYSAADQLALAPYRQIDAQDPSTAHLNAMLQALDRRPQDTMNFLIALNQRVHQGVQYQVRHESGVQTPNQTLQLTSGSCRDSSWLLVTLFRHCGVAARFVSGYLIDVVAQPAGAGRTEVNAQSRSELHAWCEVYLPGAGWIGLDPTSGLLSGEGHIPLACALQPAWAAPIEGSADVAEVTFSHRIDVSTTSTDTVVVPK
jgi:transglutaminase-like putative cysteine protease